MRKVRFSLKVLKKSIYDTIFSFGFSPESNLAQPSELNGKTGGFKSKYKTALAYVTLDGEFQTGAALFTAKHGLVVVKKNDLFNDYHPEKNIRIKVLVGGEYNNRFNLGQTYSVEKIDAEDIQSIFRPLAVIYVSYTLNLRFKLKSFNFWIILYKFL